MSAARQKEVSEAVAALATGHSVLTVHIPAVAELRGADELLRGTVIVEASFEYLMGAADGRADAYRFRRGQLGLDQHCFILDLAELCARDDDESDYRRGYNRGFNQVMTTHRQQTTLRHEDTSG